MPEPDKHLFLLDAEQSRAASAAGDFTLICTCGLPEQNAHHLTGREGVDALIAKKHEEKHELEQGLQKLYGLYLKLEVRDQYPTARYIGINWNEAYDSGRTFVVADDTDVWDDQGQQVSPPEESGHGWDWIYDVCLFQLGEDEASDDVTQIFDLETGEFVQDVSKLGLTS